MQILQIRMERCAGRWAVCKSAEAAWQCVVVERLRPYQPNSPTESHAPAH